MRILEFSVPPQYGGAKLKGFLHGYCGLSVRQFARLKRISGGVVRNGLPVIATDLLCEGDRIRVSFPDDEKFPEPVSLPFGLVFEDEDLLIADKPAGMPMYPCPGHDRDSLANTVAFHWQSRGLRFSFRPVYRLDKDTTGLVVLAKNSFAAFRLAGGVQKLYLAVCEGTLAGSGRIDGPIGLLPGHTIQRAVVPDGAEAVTLWRCLACGSGHSLLALRILTGRTHQIRVHLSDCGHPLAGDDLYGGGLEKIPRQALHCAAVRFRHPVSCAPIRFRCALPADMRGLAEEIQSCYE